MTPEDSLIHFFIPSTKIVESFTILYNGNWFNNFILRLCGMNLDSHASAYLLSEAVEGGLISTFQQLRDNHQMHIVLTNTVILHREIMKRLPKIELEQKDDIAVMLIKELIDSLSSGVKLCIDDAIVGLDKNNNIYGEPIK